MQLLKVLNGASGYKNNSVDWVWIYSQAAITMTDESGNTAKMTQAPCWLPPGWTINTGTSTDVLLGLQAHRVEEFAGFLSRLPATVFAAVSSVSASTGIRTLSANEQEFEVWANGANVAPGQVETEVWTHVP